MDTFFPGARELLTAQRLLPLGGALLIVLLGLPLARLLASLAGRLAAVRMSGAAAGLVRKGCWYAGIVITLLSAASQLGFDISVLLGAAGIMTVAVGFAAQTAASNIISGLFLVGERPFGLGDWVRAGGSTGEVISIDLLSVRLRTGDNVLVRIPNDQLLKSEITTLTHFPIRRIDLPVGVAYGTELGVAQRALVQVAELNPRILDEPASIALVTGFGDSSIDFQLYAWVSRDNYREVRSELHFEVASALAAAGVEIPFPQRTLHFGGPLPVRVTEPPGDA